MQLHSQTSEELQRHAGNFVASLSPQAQATVVTLSGELGAGKTTFAQGMAKALGIEEVVTSPTFVIEKIYALSGQKFSHLIHIDAYRLKEARDLRVIGWDEIVPNSGNLIVLEWPERVPELIPEGAVQIRFDIDEERRIISINGDEKSEIKN